ncbi:MAG: response regulator [Comamonadaceae bacterium]|nr:response regulator [Comamonadaceae bacterium]
MSGSTVRPEAKLAEALACPPAVVPASAPACRPQVLYIEDDALNAELMRALFATRPHLDLVVAVDGAEAFALGPTIRPSLLLVDLRLPDCLGSELLPLLRLRFGWRQVPAVAVTAEHGYGGGSHGFVEVWHKPIDLNHVLSRLDEWLAPEPRSPR